jgi:hypothetical protein
VHPALNPSEGRQPPPKPPTRRENAVVEGKVPKIGLPPRTGDIDAFEVFNFIVSPNFIKNAT